MTDSIQKGYSSIYELPSEVRASFDERDQKKWLDNYTNFLGEGTSEKEIEDAKFKAWKSMVDAPSSLAVESWASTEIRDADGELVPISSIEENMERYLHNGGIVHDSHSNVPIGTVWGWEKRFNEEYGQDGIVVYFNVNREGEVAERARDDILSGRKNSMSIGAEAPRGGYKCDDRGCYVERDVTDLYEISICETPANQSAVFLNVGKDIAKSKKPLKGEVFRIGIKDITVHQDYTTCPLQKCKHDLLMKGFKNIHITDNGIVTAKSKKNEYKLFKAIHKMGYPFRYNLIKQQFEIIPDYGVEQATEEALSNGWAHEDQVGHVCLTKEIPKEVFIDWYDRGFIVKIGDFYCLKADDVAKDNVKKTHIPDMTERYPEGMRSIAEDDSDKDYCICGREITEDEITGESLQSGRLNYRCKGCGNEGTVWHEYVGKGTRKKVKKSIAKKTKIKPVRIWNPNTGESKTVDYDEDYIELVENGDWEYYADESDMKESTKKKVKKDGGAMGVGDAGASNPMYSPRPKTVLVDDKKYGKKRKAKKDVIDDGNIHYPKAKVDKSSTSIEKRCPNGYHKDEETGECVKNPPKHVSQIPYAQRKKKIQQWHRYNRGH